MERSHERCETYCKWCVILIISYTVTYYRYLACDECQRIGDKLKTTRPELHPILVHYLWYYIGIDFIGPLLPVSHEAVGVAYELLKVWLINIFNTGKSFIPLLAFYDNRSPKNYNIWSMESLKMFLNGKLTSKLNIKHHLTTPYHPQIRFHI